MNNGGRRPIGVENPAKELRNVALYTQAALGIRSRSTGSSTTGTGGMLRKGWLKPEPSRSSAGTRSAATTSSANTNTLTERWSRPLWTSRITFGTRSPRMSRTPGAMRHGRGACRHRGGDEQLHAADESTRWNGAFTGRNDPVVDSIPRFGWISQFQWRVHGGRGRSAFILDMFAMVYLSSNSLR